MSDQMSHAGPLYLGGTKDAFMTATTGTHKQSGTNSCWACSARHIVNFLESKQVYVSDLAVATKYGLSDVSKMASAADVLAKLDHDNNTDDEAIPNPSEIEDHLAMAKPLLANLGDTKGHDNSF